MGLECSWRSMTNCHASRQTNLPPFIWGSSLLGTLEREWLLSSVEHVIVADYIIRYVLY